VLSPLLPRSLPGLATWRRRQDGSIAYGEEVATARRCERWHRESGCLLSLDDDPVQRAAQPLIENSTERWTHADLSMASTFGVMPPLVWRPALRYHDSPNDAN